MRDKIPSWVLIAVAAAAAAVAIFFGIQANSGPRLPADYDPNAPIGTKLAPPAGFQMPKEPPPPPPPPGVGGPPGPGAPGGPPGPR